MMLKFLLPTNAADLIILFFKQLQVFRSQIKKKKKKIHIHDASIFFLIYLLLGNNISLNYNESCRDCAANYNPAVINIRGVPLKKYLNLYILIK